MPHCDLRLSIGDWLCVLFNIVFKQTDIAGEHNAADELSWFVLQSLRLFTITAIASGFLVLLMPDINLPYV